MHKKIVVITATVLIVMATIGALTAWAGAFTADPLVPVNDLWNVDLGYSLNFTNSRLDFVVAHAFSRSRSIDNNVGSSSLSSVDGKYSLVAQVLGISYNIKF